MAITINGTAGTLAGIVVGGLPDGIVDDGTLATDSVTATKLKSDAIVSGDLPAGSVLQVVQATHSSEIQIGTSYTTLMAITITPTSATSEILVSITAGGMANLGDDIYFRLQRGSTTIWEHGRYGYVNDGWVPSPWVNQYLDTPSTTSAVTYTWSGKRDATGDVRFTDLGNGSTNPGIAIAMEIGV